jgi:hypothetical protein
MIRQVVREERKNHFIKEQTHQQNVKKVIEFQMKKNVKRISNDERAQNLRDADVKNLQKAFQIS